MYCVTAQSVMRWVRDLGKHVRVTTKEQVRTVQRRIRIINTHITFCQRPFSIYKHVPLHLSSTSHEKRKPTPMKFFDSAIAAVILGICISSVAAAPIAGGFDASVTGKDRNSRFITRASFLHVIVDGEWCVANAAITKRWTENALRRYRVAFSTTDSSIVYRLGEVCDNFDDHVTSKLDPFCRHRCPRF